MKNVEMERGKLERLVMKALSVKDVCLVAEEKKMAGIVEEAVQLNLMFVWLKLVVMGSELVTKAVMMGLTMVRDVMQIVQMQLTAIPVVMIT